MKFSNGYWLSQKGVQVFSPVQVFLARVEKDRAVLCCTTRPVRERGDTMDGVNLTVEITAPYPEVLRIRTHHHAGVKRRAPAFELAEMQEGLFRAEETDTTITVHSGSTRVEIDRASAVMTFWQGDRRLTASEGKDLAYVKQDWHGYYYDKGPEDAYMRGQLEMEVGETIYGLGERFGPLAKNGQSIEIWNEDGGTSTQQAYKNIPFYLSSRGYGLFVNHPERVSFEVGSEMVSKVSFTVRGEMLDFFLIGGPTMKDALHRYTDITGHPSLPPAWTFGLWLSTSFTTNYDEDTVNSFVDGMIERGIPLSVFHFDCFWMRAFHWCDFLWDPAVFPDPEGMLKRLKAKGLKICVWINSYVGQESHLFAEGAEKGYFLRRPNGDVWQWDMWQPGLALVDFTNPEACKWYSAQLERLLDMGVDCFKTDFGERIPTDCVYHNGADPEMMHNYYTYLYNKTVYDTIVRKRGKEEAVLFARSATAGGQKFPVHWGGDCWSSYVAMEQSLRGGLSLTSSGFGFWSHDIGGFEHTSTADVYKRWCAFGLLSSHSRLHGSSSYRVPWAYDEEAVDVLRRFTRLKYSLMPYLYRQAVLTNETGVPMMRMMPLEFPEERTCVGLASQYMLGDSLLVSPVMNDQGMAEYYLPEGRWTSLLTGEERQGGRWFREHHDYMSLPLYVRPGSIIPVGAHEDTVQYDYALDVDWRIFALEEGHERTCVICGMDGQEEASLTVTHTTEGYALRLMGGKSCTVTLMNVTAQSAEGAAMTIEGGSTRLRLSGEGEAFVRCGA